MENVMYARALMGMSLGFHIVFSAIAIGIPLFFFISESLALRTDNETYQLMGRRWARHTLMAFAIGAVSGTILSFEFGLLWPKWMEFSGSIIGLPFALEGFAFFLEAIFLAIYIYGWSRLSPLARWLATIPITVCAAASAAFVISANGWMNQPTGFTLLDGRVVEVDPIAAMLNPAMPYEVIHGTLSAYVATGFAIAGIYAFKIFRGDRSEYARKGLMLGMAVGGITIPLQILTGDLSAKFVARSQPEKFAAMEAQFETERGIPLRLGGVPYPDEGAVRYVIEIPKLGSYLAFGDFDAEVRGLNSFPRDEIPNVFIVHYSFQLMVAIGFTLLFLALWFWGLALWRRSIPTGRRLLLAITAAAPLGFIAIEAGWFVTEFGRQPWVIYRVMRTTEGATPREGIVFVFGLFLLVYLALSAGLAFLLLRGRSPTNSFISEGNEE